MSNSMKRNKIIKKTARGNYYWKEIKDIFFVNGICVIPNTRVNKNIIAFMRNHPNCSK